MKLKFIALALLPFTFAACQSSDIQQAGDLAMATLQQKNAHQILPAYHWELNHGLEQPVVLSFDAQGRLSAVTGCNGLGTSWAVKNNIISTSEVVGTEMACETALMEQERFVSQLLQKREIPFTLNVTDRNKPILTLVAADGQTIEFTGKMTPETKYQGQAETIFLEISPDTKPCTGVTQQRCLQVKQVKYDQNGLKTQVDKDWTLFYDQIEGFQHSPNERQIIRVKRFEIKHPAADQSKYAYIYDMAVEREAVRGSL
jgi:heat shock protein HslJ